MKHLKIVVLAGILALGAQFAVAWVNPTQPPPSGNVSAPLTIGNILQTKAAKLRTPSTVATDAGTTLVTKDYVDAQVAASAGQPIRGGAYGLCRMQFAADQVTAVGAGEFRWPVTSCTISGGSPVIACASGYSFSNFVTVQMNTANSSYTAQQALDMDTYFKYGQCFKL